MEAAAGLEPAGVKSVGVRISPPTGMVYIEDCEDG